MYFFFFQAEDGIRDLTVTGVQTCALPIARGARAGVVGDAALEDEDLLVADVPVARDHRARLVSHEDGTAVALPEKEAPAGGPAPHRPPPTTTPFTPARAETTYLRSSAP